MQQKKVSRETCYLSTMTDSELEAMIDYEETLFVAFGIGVAVVIILFFAVMAIIT